MGKSLPSPKHFARMITSNRPNTQTKPTSKARPVSSSEPQLRLKTKAMEVGISNSAAAAAAAAKQQQRRTPLTEVVADCVNRWFQDTLKEAKAGDAAMQVLVGQMYSAGYGVPKDIQEGRAWITKASKSRSSALKVGDKRPGYNASDSDSDDTKGDNK